MGHSDKREAIAIHRLRADSQHQACHGNREKQQYRKNIVCKTLDGEFASIAHAKLYRKNQTHHQDHCSNVQEIEMHEPANAVNRKLLDDKSEKKDTIRFGVVGQRFKMKPAEY